MYANDFLVYPSCNFLGWDKVIMNCRRSITLSSTRFLHYAPFYIHVRTVHDSRMFPLLWHACISWEITFFPDILIRPFNRDFPQSRIFLITFLSLLMEHLRIRIFRCTLRKQKRKGRTGAARAPHPPLTTWIQSTSRFIPLKLAAVKKPTLL